MKTDLTGDASSTSELKKATEALNAQTTEMTSKPKSLKTVGVLAVVTSASEGCFLMVIGIGIRSWPTPTAQGQSVTRRAMILQGLGLS